MKIYYTAGRGTYRHSFEAEFEPDPSPTDLEELAEQAAADFHSEHDGWESAWPMEITLYDGSTGPAMATFTVEREYEPCFSVQTTTQPDAGREHG